MTDKPEKPIDPGPACGDRERREYAEDNAAWSDWVAQHGEDDQPQGEQNPRPDGTSPRTKKPLAPPLGTQS